MNKIKRFLWLYRGNAALWVILLSMLIYRSASLKEGFGLAVSLSTLLICLSLWIWVEIKVENKVHKNLVSAKQIKYRNE
jgi:hypothetical protein